MAGRLGEGKWRSFHFDNYAHAYYVKACAASTSTYRAGSWTAWGFTFTDVDLDDSRLQGPRRAFPNDFDYTNGTWATAAVLKLKQCARTCNVDAYCSAAAVNSDYKYPLGSGEHTRARVGTAYQPLDLLDQDCQSNKGLIRVLCRVADHLAAPQGPALVRLDIGIWWRLMKAFSNGSLGPLRQALSEVVFYMAPWHTYKHLAVKRWESLSTGGIIAKAEYKNKSFRTLWQPRRGRLRALAVAPPQLPKGLQ